MDKVQLRKILMETMKEAIEKKPELSDKLRNFEPPECDIRSMVLCINEYMELFGVKGEEPSFTKGVCLNYFNSLGVKSPEKDPIYGDDGSSAECPEIYMPGSD